MSKTTKIILGGIAGTCFITACIIFAIFDLDISNAIVNLNSPFGLFMEVPGMLVAPFIFILSGIVIAMYSLKDKERKYSKLYTFAGFFFALIGIGYCTTIYISFPIFVSILAYILTGVVCGLLIVYLNKKSKENICYIFRVAVTAIIYLLSVLIIVNIIKIFWGRVRYREMTDIAQFSKWFIPQGITGDRSFPSGHTANAATLYVITLFAPKLKHKISKILCYAIPIAWIVVMAVSRVIVGAHFSSDVLFGAAVSILLFYLSKKFVFERVKG